MEKWKQKVYLKYCTGYVDYLMGLIFKTVFVVPAPYTEEVLKSPIPEDLCAQ